MSTVSRRTFLGTGAVAAAGAAVAGLPAAASADTPPVPPTGSVGETVPSQSLILHNGKIQTMDDGNPVVSVVAIRYGGQTQHD